MILKIKNVALFIVVFFTLANCAIMKSKVIGTSTKLNTIEVAQFDFKKKMDWITAQESCLKLGQGSRLPTMEKLKLISVSRDSVPGIKEDIYWSSESFISGTAWNFKFAPIGEYGKPRFDKQYNNHLIRPVRTIE